MICYNENAWNLKQKYTLTFMIFNTDYSFTVLQSKGCHWMTQLKHGHYSKERNWLSLKWLHGKNNNNQTNHLINLETVLHIKRITLLFTVSLWWWNKHSPMDGRPQTYLAVLPCLVVAILEAHQLCWLEKKDKSKSLRNYSISFWGKKNSHNT